VTGTVTHLACWTSDLVSVAGNICPVQPLSISQQPWCRLTSSFTSFTASLDKACTSACGPTVAVDVVNDGRSFVQQLCRDFGLPYVFHKPHLSCRVTDEGILGLSSLSGLCSFSYGYTSMPEADDVAAAIGRQFKSLTGA